MRVILILFVAVLLLSCDKNEDDRFPENIETDSVFRIQQAIMSTSGGFEYRKTFYNYSENHLSEIIRKEPGLDTTWVDINRQTIEYSGNKITVTSYTNQAGTWMLFDKMEIFVEGEIVTEEIHYEMELNELVKNAKYVYIYSDNGLSEWSKFYMTTVLEYESLKGVISYENGRIKSHEVFLNMDDDWGNYKKEIPTYSNGKIASWVYSEYFTDYWCTLSKMNFYYSNEAIDRSVVYYFVEEEWDSIVGYGYTFNEHDLLTELSLPEGSKTSYIYEYGEGNTGIVLYDPMQEFNGRPKLKSSLSAESLTPFYKRYLSILNR